MKVLYTAAHSGFDLSRIPLGGGAAVCRHLAEEWHLTRPFDLEVLGPCTLWPDQAALNLVALSERGYAHFCRAFEQASTERVLKEDPKTTVVLANDVSEGPDFKRLAEADYSIYTIYHVDVVDYVARMYLRSWIRPETLTLFYSALERYHLAGTVPNILKLVVQKQADSVRYSKGLIVPSTEMKAVLQRCYPDISPSKIHVIPWGIWQDPVDEDSVKKERQTLEDELKIPEFSSVLLTLSRISPEKGQDRLLRALALWERQQDYPTNGIVVLVAGEAAYMQGKRFDVRLRKLAASLKKTRVHFTGFASGARKQALFQRADLYVFPSRHESYGLSLLEAMQAGLPVLACDDHGAREVMTPEVGDLVEPSSENKLPPLLLRHLRQMLSDREHLLVQADAARQYAQAHPFKIAAAQVADLVMKNR